MSPEDPRTRRGLSPGPAQHLHGGQAEVGHLVLQYVFLFLLLVPINNVLK